MISTIAYKKEIYINSIESSKLLSIIQKTVTIWTLQEIQISEYHL